MGLSFHASELINRLEVSNRRFCKVLRVHDRVICEGLGFLGLILTLVKSSVFEEFASVGRSEFFGAALVALARQLLRWLVVLAPSLTSDRHIVVIGGVIRVGVRREHFGRL